MWREYCSILFLSCKAFFLKKQKERFETALSYGDLFYFLMHPAFVLFVVADEVALSIAEGDYVDVGVFVIPVFGVGVDFI